MGVTPGTVPRAVREATWIRIPEVVYTAIVGAIRTAACRAIPKETQSATCRATWTAIL